MSKEKENYVDMKDDAKDVKIKSKAKKRPDIQLYQPRGARIASMQSVKKDPEKNNSTKIQIDSNLNENKEKNSEAKFKNNEVNLNLIKNKKLEVNKSYSKNEIEAEKSKINDKKQERVGFDQPNIKKVTKKLNKNTKTNESVVNEQKQKKEDFKVTDEVDNNKLHENNTENSYNQEIQQNTKAIKTTEMNQPMTKSMKLQEDTSEPPSNSGNVRGLIKLPSELFKNNVLGQIDIEENNRRRININTRNKRSRNDSSIDTYKYENTQNGSYINPFASDSYYNSKIKDSYNNKEDRYDKIEDVSTTDKKNTKNLIQQSSVPSEVVQMLSKCMMLQTQINKYKESIKHIHYQKDNAIRKNNNENNVKITIITKNNEHIIGKDEENFEDGDVYDKQFKLFEKLSSFCMTQLQSFKEIILKCPENVFEWKVLDLMWKDGVLAIVDSYKEEIERINTNTISKHDTRRWCDDDVDMEFYHQTLSSCFNLHLHQSIRLYSSLYDDLNNLQIQENDASRKQIRVLESIRYRICLSLGDLFRYKLINLTKTIKNSSNNNNNNSNNNNNNNNNKEIYQLYMEAQKWYMEAQRRSSTSHRPYEYLARLASSMNKNLDVFYYSIRSISSSSGFNTPSYLISLFHGVFKMAHVEEKNRRERIQNEKKKNNIKNKHHFVFGHRSEIWYSSDGCRKVDESSEEEDEEDDPLLKTHDQMKIYQLFQLDFLNLHGKLYNKINLDTLEDNWNHLIKEFTYLMNTHPTPLNQQKLIQVIIITIFSISQCSHNRLLQETVVKYGMMIFECLCTCFTQSLATFICQDKLHEDINNNEEDSLANKLLSIIENEKSSYGVSNLSDDDETTNKKRNLTSFIDKLNITLAPISVWSDWMMTNYHIWATVPLSMPSTNKKLKENEQSFIRIFNALLKIPLENYVGSRSHETFNGVDVTLAEDTMVHGFSPLASAAALQSDIVASEEFSMSTRGMLVRLHKLKLLSDFMYGLEPPSLNYHPSTHQYSLIAHPLCDSNESHKASDNTSFTENSIKNNDDNIGYKKFKSKYEDDEEDDDDVDYDMDDVVSTRTTESKIKSWADYDEKDPFGAQLSEKMEELRVKKEALEKQWHKTNRSKKVFDQSKSRSLLVEVRPYHLIFDTNCYIAYLHAIKTILSTQKFCVVVPLVVIQELDYLALNGRADADAEWNEHLKNQASKAVKFLEDEFENKKCQIKAMTSKGSIMDSIMFRCEDLDVALGRNNDDKILNCCLYFIKDKPADYMPENPDDPLKLARSVVLLTDDKNLRGKAHVQNVPVKTVTWFMKWSRS